MHADKEMLRKMFSEVNKIKNKTETYQKNSSQGRGDQQRRQWKGKSPEERKKSVPEIFKLIHIPWVIPL